MLTKQNWPVFELHVGTGLSGSLPRRLLWGSRISFLPTNACFNSQDQLFFPPLCQSNAYGTYQNLVSLPWTQKLFTQPEPGQMILIKLLAPVFIKFKISRLNSFQIKVIYEFLTSNKARYRLVCWLAMANRLFNQFNIRWSIASVTPFLGDT